MTIISSLSNITAIFVLWEIVISYWILFHSDLLFFNIIINIIIMCPNEGGSDPKELWEKRNGSIICVLGIYVLTCKI